MEDKTKIDELSNQEWELIVYALDLKAVLKGGLPFMEAVRQLRKQLK